MTNFTLEACLHYIKANYKIKCILAPIKMVNTVINITSTVVLCEAYSKNKKTFH